MHAATYRCMHAKMHKHKQTHSDTHIIYIHIYGTTFAKGAIWVPMIFQVFKTWFQKHHSLDLGLPILTWDPSQVVGVFSFHSLGVKWQDSGFISAQSFGNFWESTSLHMWVCVKFHCGLNGGLHVWQAWLISRHQQADWVGGVQKAS